MQRLAPNPGTELVRISGDERCLLAGEFGSVRGPYRATRRLRAFASAASNSQGEGRLIPLEEQVSTRKTS